VSAKKNIIQTEYFKLLILWVKNWCFFKSILTRMYGNNMNLRPISDHLIVKAEAKEEKTKSGIVLPDTADKEKPEKGEVLAVGPGRVLDNGQVAAMPVKVGDKILFKKYAPDEVKIDGETFLFLSEHDIVAIIE